MSRRKKYAGLRELLSSKAAVGEFFVFRRAEAEALLTERDNLHSALDMVRVELAWIATNSAPLGTDSGCISTERAARAAHAGVIAVLSDPADQHSSDWLAAHDTEQRRLGAAEWWDAVTPSPFALTRRQWVTAGVLGILMALAFLGLMFGRGVFFLLTR